ncbi:MAG TPA: SCO family protein [Dongiaceae bacterium]|nr:SCO family protein [Dongiaceae bacterium]
MVARTLWGLALVLLGWPLLLAAKDLPINTRLGGDFTLQSTVVDKDQLSDFKGKLVLLNFGYTSCPDVCPMVLSRMTQVMNTLEEDSKETRAQVQPLFITFDPERDTLEKLGAYLKHFGPDFIGMTGTPEQIAAVAKQFGVIYLPQKSDSAAGTLFAHSDYIYLLDDQGRVRALFSTKEPIDDMVDAVESLLDK